MKLDFIAIKVYVAFTITWIITKPGDQHRRSQTAEEAYHKLIESSVKPSSNLGASSRNYCERTSICEMRL